MSNNIIEPNISNTTLSMTRGAFGGLAVYTGLRAVNTDNNKDKLTSSIATLILTVAFIHYNKLNDIEILKDPNLSLSIRYSDWFVTVPLLIFELFLVMDWITIDDNGKLNSDYFDELYKCLIYSEIMLFSGYIGEVIGDGSTMMGIIFFVISLIALVLTATTILGVMDEPGNSDKTWIVSFFSIWILYGLGYLMKIIGCNNNKIGILYDILDLISKGIFAFSIVTLDKNLN